MHAVVFTCKNSLKKRIQTVQAKLEITWRTFIIVFISFYNSVLMITINFLFCCRVSSFSFSMCCETNGSVGANVYHMTITWLSHDYHMTITWLSRDCHVTITWPSHDHHMTVTWPSHVCHMTAHWMSDVYWCTCTIRFGPLISVFSIDSPAALWEEKVLQLLSREHPCSGTNKPFMKPSVVWALLTLVLLGLH